MSERARAFLAFLFAPALAAAAYYIMYMLVRGPDPSQGLGSQFLVGSAFASIGTYTKALLFGLPIYLLLRHFKILSFATALASGVAVPAALIAWSATMGWLADDHHSLFSFYREGCQEIVENVRTACGESLLLRDRVLSLLTGALGGVFFWLIYARGRLTLCGR